MSPFTRNPETTIQQNCLCFISITREGWRNAPNGIGDHIQTRFILPWFIISNFDPLPTNPKVLEFGAFMSKPQNHLRWDLPVPSDLHGSIPLVIWIIHLLSWYYSRQHQLRHWPPPYGNNGSSWSKSTPRSGKLYGYLSIRAWIISQKIKMMLSDLKFETDFGIKSGFLSENVVNLIHFSTFGTGFWI